MDKKTILRDSNIELLRILAILSVIVCHYNNPGMGGGLKYVLPGSINQYLLYFIMSVCVSAVDLFIIITGYYMCRSNKIRLVKPLQLLLQVVFFSFVIYITRVILHTTPFSVRALFRALIPANWFVILYITLYLLSPYINKMIASLSRKELRKFVLIAFLLFSVYPTVVDVSAEVIGSEWVGLSTIGAYGSQYGYQIVNFILMYMIGAYLRNCSINCRKSHLTLFLIVDVLFLGLWAALNDKIGFFTERSAWEYCNPLLIFEAASLFLLFHSLKIKNSVIINKLAAGAFTVYLLHMQLIQFLNIEKYVTGNPVVMLLHLAVASCVIYGICWIVYLIYDSVMTPLFLFFEKRICNYH